MLRVIAFLALLALFVPVSINAGSFSGKPLDFVLSDFFLILFPFGFYAVFKGGLSGLGIRYTAAIFLYLFLCVFIILVSQSWNDGGLSSIASFLRAYRPFFAFYVGFLVLKLSQGRAESWSVLLSIFLVWTIFISDVLFNHRFPNPRWGGYFFSFDVYGFPNSPAFFYVVVLSIILAACLSRGVSRSASLVSAVLLSLIIIFVGSRNAIASLVLLFVFLAMLGYVRTKYIIYLSPLGGAAIFFVAWLQVDMTLLQNKAERSVSEGTLYGRANVWNDVLELVLEKPLFGYAFEPLSMNYADHGTAHNQYIEYLYKTGALGLLASCLIWFIVAMCFWRAARFYRGEFLGVFYGAILCAFLVCIFSNLAQPNLTYTITQYFFVFYAGMAWCRIRNVRGIESETNSSRYG